MTRVAALETRSDDRVRIVFEDGRFGEIPARLLREDGPFASLCVGDDLSEREVEGLLREERALEAEERALRYLSHRARSRAELERYLRRKGYEEPIAARVLARLEELGYVDDRTFAEAHVRDRIRLKPRGRFKLLMELREKGVAEADAGAAIEAAFREMDVTERELLERCARKRWRARRTDDPEKLRRRISGYLRRRGFRGSEVREVVDDLLDRLEE